MPTSSFDSKAPPTEKTRLGISLQNKPIPQGKKARSLFSQVVVVTLSLVFLSLMVCAYLSSSSASSSVAKQSLLRSVDKQLYETDSNVFPTAFLVESETKTDLQQEAKGTTELSVEKATTFILKFPEGVYDPSVIDGTRGIFDKCNNYMDENKDKSTDPNFIAELLACQIYQGDENQPIVLGTLKPAVNVVKRTTNMLDISSSDASSLFEDHAFAVMIDRGCFKWDNKQTLAKQTSLFYNDEATYRKAYSKTTGVDMRAHARGIIFGINAGYSSHKSFSTVSETNETTAYGYTTNTGEVGQLTNECFSSKSRFATIKDLVKPEWVRCWKLMREDDNDSVDDLLNLPYDCFSQVYKGGATMPFKYIYGSGFSFEFSTSYSSSSETEKKHARKAIYAGIDIGKSGGAGGGTNTSSMKWGADIMTNISSAVNESTTSTGFQHKVESKLNLFGANVDKSCFATKTCPAMIKESVEATRTDFSKLGYPTSLGNEFITLDKIIQYYFDDVWEDEGLPKSFPSAVKSYLYNRPDTVCWGYDFVMPRFSDLAGLTDFKRDHMSMANTRMCWTENKKIMPTGISGKPRKGMYVYNNKEYYKKEFGGIISTASETSPHPESCCEKCESTHVCDDDCQSFLYHNYHNSKKTYQTRPGRSDVEITHLVYSSCA